MQALSLHRHDGALQQSKDQRSVSLGTKTQQLRLFRVVEVAASN